MFCMCFKIRNKLKLKTGIVDKRLLLIVAAFSFLYSVNLFSQTSYGAAACYGLRKAQPGYTGSAIQVRRTCDDAVRDIGFTSCGDLDTNTLKTFVVAANPLSSITASAAAAFSLRRLRCAYAGSAIQVRRSNDNATLNIGFTSWGDLDTAAMKTFVGANSAFVTIWYDQSGNARNALQATAGNQPRIMNAGVIEYQNGRPAVRWLGMGYALRTAGFTAFGSAACFNGVAKVNTNVTYNTIVNKCTNNFPAPIDFYNNNCISGNGTTATFFSYPTTFNSAQPLGIWTYQAAPAGSASGYYNSTLAVTGAVGTYADNGNPLVLGSRFDAVTGLNGWISEVITWGVLPSSTERNFVEWTQAAYYNIAGPLLTPIPPGAPSGFVTTWYDQSGGGAHAIQSANSNQPRIINVGVIEKSGTKSAIRFTGAPVNLSVNTPVNTYPVSISVLANTGGATTNGAFVKLAGNTAGSAGIGIGVGATNTNYDNTGFSVIGLKELTVWCPSNPGVNYPSSPFIATETQQTAAAGSAMNIYLNGTDIPLNSFANATSGSAITGLLSIGGYTNTFARNPVVRETEVIVFGTSLNTTRRTLLETNQSAHYNIAISNSKYTPPTATTYNLFVNGVGREEATDSVAGTRSSVGLGFTIGTTATDFLKDNGDYITAGINCPITPTISLLNLPATVVARWFNDWYVNKTDIDANHGNMSFYFDFSDYGYGGTPGLASNYRLLYRNSPVSNFSIVPGTTASVAGDRVLFSLNASNVINNYYYTIGTTNAAASPLPVELTEFDAVKNNSVVDVKWVTVVERESDYFTIQRSVDALNFTDIGQVKSQGTKLSRTSYLFKDIDPLNGVSYYRLKQVDLNKEFTYSKIVMVNFGSESITTIYPNPTNGVLKIDNCSEYSKISIVDNLGRLVHTTNIMQNNMQVDLHSLLDGNYFLILSNVNSDKKFTTKIIIEKQR